MSISEEEMEVRQHIETALKSLGNARSSSYWSYTREFQLGKLTAALLILEELLGRERGFLA